MVFTTDQRDAYDNKGLGLGATNTDVNNQKFDGVILAPQPWIGNPDDQTKGGGRRVPNSIGWLSGNIETPSILGSSQDDAIFFDFIYQNNAGKGPLNNVYINGGAGNDIIIGDMGKMIIDTAIGNDTIIFGYSRNGVREKAFDDNAGVFGDEGKDSFCVTTNFGYSYDSGGYDRLQFPWRRDEIGFKQGKDYSWGFLSNPFGDGTAVYTKALEGPFGTIKADLIAYIPGCSTESFDWLIKQNLVQFGIDPASANVDNLLLA